MKSLASFGLLAAALLLGGCADDGDASEVSRADQVNATEPVVEADRAEPEGEPVPVEAGGRAGDACGGRGASPCATGLVCIFDDGAACGAADKPGKCFDPRIVFCTADYDPVCSCEGKTYSNACAARVAGASVKSQGACE